MKEENRMKKARQLLGCLLVFVLVFCMVPQAFSEEAELQAIQEEINYQALAVGLAAWLNGENSEKPTGSISQIVSPLMTNTMQSISSPVTVKMLQ